MAKLTSYLYATSYCKMCIGRVHVTSPTVQLSYHTFVLLNSCPTVHLSYCPTCTLVLLNSCPTVHLSYRTETAPETAGANQVQARCPHLNRCIIRCNQVHRFKIRCPYLNRCKIRCTGASQVPVPEQVQNQVHRCKIRCPYLNRCRTLPEISEGSSEISGPSMKSQKAPLNSREPP